MLISDWLILRSSSRSGSRRSSSTPLFLLLSNSLPTETSTRARRTRRQWVEQVTVNQCTPMWVTELRSVVLLYLRLSLPQHGPGDTREPRERDKYSSNPPDRVSILMVAIYFFFSIELIYLYIDSSGPLYANVGSNEQDFKQPISRSSTLPSHR